MTWYVHGIQKLATYINYIQPVVRLRPYKLGLKDRGAAEAVPWGGGEATQPG